MPRPATGGRLSFPTILDLGLVDRLPLHVARCIGTAAGQRNDVIDCVAAGPLPVSCSWARMFTLKFSHRAVAADGPGVGLAVGNKQQPDQEREEYLHGRGLLVVLGRSGDDGLEQRKPGVPVSQEVQNLLIVQRVLPRADDAEKVNVGFKVT
jgi:hypothetical protein